MHRGVDDELGLSFSPALHVASELLYADLAGRVIQPVPAWLDIGSTFHCCLPEHRYFQGDRLLDWDHMVGFDPLDLMVDGVHGAPQATRIYLFGVNSGLRLELIPGSTHYISN